MTNDRQGGERQSPRFIDARRRGFLQGAALATGAAVGGGALAAPPSADLVTDDVGKGADAGYRETDHVRAYYAAARG